MPSAFSAILLVCMCHALANAETKVTKLTDTKFFGVLDLTARDNQLWATGGYIGNPDPDPWWLIRWTGSKWENMTSELPAGVQFFFGEGIGIDGTVFLNQVVFDDNGQAKDYFLHRRDVTTGKWTQVDQNGIWRVDAYSASKYLITQDNFRRSLREVVNGVTTFLPETPKWCKGIYDNDGQIWCTELPVINDGTLFRLNGQKWERPAFANDLPREKGEQAVITVYDSNRMAAYVSSFKSSRLFLFNGKVWSEVTDLQMKPDCDQLAIDSKSVFCRDRAYDLYRIDV